MKSLYILVATFCILTGGVATAGRIHAASVTIEINNPGNSSFSMTPLWYGFHTGQFGIFNPGQHALASLEALAADGIVGGYQSDFGPLPQ